MIWSNNELFVPLYTHLSSITFELRRQDDNVIIKEFWLSMTMGFDLDNHCWCKTRWSVGLGSGGGETFWSDRIIRRIEVNIWSVLLLWVGEIDGRPCPMRNKRGGKRFQEIRLMDFELAVKLWKKRFPTSRWEFLPEILNETGLKLIIVYF